MKGSVTERNTDMFVCNTCLSTPKMAPVCLHPSSPAHNFPLVDRQSTDLPHKKLMRSTGETTQWKLRKADTHHIITFAWDIQFEKMRIETLLG
jgi:hypothetical protein